VTKGFPLLLTTVMGLPLVFFPLTVLYSGRPIEMDKLRILA
jgi:hypothetical protein